MSNSDRESFTTAAEGESLSSRDGSYFSLTSGNSVYFTAPSSSQEPSLLDEATGGDGASDPTQQQTESDHGSRKSKKSGKSSPSSSPKHGGLVPSASVTATKKITAQLSTDSTVSTADSSSTTLADFPSDYEDEDDGAVCKDVSGESYDHESELDAECYNYFRSQCPEALLDPIVVDESRAFRTFSSDNLHSRSTSSASNNSYEVDENIDGVDVQVKTDVSRICNEIAISSKPNTNKENEIEFALGIEENFDKLRKLRELAIEDGGLLTNPIRKRVWPLLLGISQHDLDKVRRNHYHLPKFYNNVSKEIQNLVHLDVSRVLKRFPPGLSDPQQDHLLTYLTKLICSALEKNPKVYYYQGFHDISLTFLLVCISQESTPFIAYLCLNKMIQSNLGPFMEITMESVHNLIHVSFAILEQENQKLFKKIVVDSRCPVAFCLPWVLTWFSHTLPNENDIFRLYDFILGCTTEIYPACLIPIFISTSLVLRNGEQIFQRTVNENELAIMHHTLSLLPSELSNLEPWLEDSLLLMRKYKGRETQLMKRGKEIRDYQNQLWSEETSNNNRYSRRDRRVNRDDDGNGNRSIIMRIGRFIFVKHRWYTVALIVLGTAYLVQTKYNVIPIENNNNMIKLSNIYLNVKSIVQKYFILPAITWIGNLTSQFEFEGLVGSRSNQTA